MPSIEPPGEVPGVSDSQGIQVGLGNTQYNNWAPKAPLDPAALSALNPHTAVARLQQLSHDDLVDFFARAKPGEVGDILDIMFDVDLAKLTAVLTDINRRQATELIEATSLDRRLFALLPEASEAIARKAASLRWTGPGALDIWTDGYARSYKDGHVFWSSESGTRMTVGAIDGYFAEHSSECGFPMGDQETTTNSPFHTAGIRQKFRRGTVYSSSHGVFLVTDDRFYQGELGSGGWLGFPVGQARNSNAGLGESQQFEGGSIYSYPLGVTWSAGRGKFAVHREIVENLQASYQEFRAVSKELDAVSSLGSPGAIQYFEVIEGQEVYRTAAYLSDLAPVVVVVREAFDYYRNLGAEKSWLGFPTRPVRVYESGMRIQNFEGGVIYWRPETGSHAVTKSVLEVISQYREFQVRIGYPVSEEQSSGEDGADRIQFFQYAVVTLRQGNYEVWVRPHPDLNPESSSERPVVP